MSLGNNLIVLYIYYNQYSSPQSAQYVIKAYSYHFEDPLRNLDRFAEVVYYSIIYQYCLRRTNISSVFYYNPAICALLGCKLAAHRIILTVHAKVSHTQARPKGIEPIEAASGEEMLAE